MLTPEFYYNCRLLEFSEVFLLKTPLTLFYMILVTYLASARLAIQMLPSIWSVCVPRYRSYSRRIGILFGTIPTLLLL